MARKTPQSSNPRRTSQQNSKPQARKSPQARAQANQSLNKGRFIDEYARRDLIGIAFAVLAVVLLACVCIKSDAIITSFLSTALHLSLGIGAYLLPLFLLGIAACFLIRFERERVPARVAIGLILVLVSILAILALGTNIPANSDMTRALFNDSELISRGGYLGAAIAWVGLNLLGSSVSYIIMIGLGCAGLAIIGLSISKFIERMRNAHEDRKAEGDESGEALPLAKILRPQKRAANVTPDGDTSNISQAETKVLPAHPLATPAATAATFSQGAKRRGQKTSLRSLQTGSSSQSFSEQNLPDQSQSLPTRRFEPIEADTTPLTRKLGRHAAGDAAGDKGTASDSSDRASTAKSARATSSRGTQASGGPEPLAGFKLPPMSLLKTSRDSKKDAASESELKETAALLQETLEDFSIMAQVVGWVAGPTVTLFKVDLPAGVRVSRVTALNDDIALALAAPGVRIFAPIPGTNYVGIEVPNRSRQTVFLGDVLKAARGGPLQIAIGKDVEGSAIVSDLAKMPHLLIGGTTGSGKSVSINAMIMSILMRATPAEVRFIMIDPKRVEFTPYNGIPHLYVPVVTEAKEAASALSWGVAEMERRLKVFSKVGARNISQYNVKAKAAQDAIERAQRAGSEAPENEVGPQLPYIVIIIDELADLMMNVGKEVEFSISRIAQLARAAGIHLIVATQRPSTNVVTGLIKANITNRIAFNVASGIDSRVVLDTPGAENLIGLGDLLFSKPEYPKPQRIQGCFVSEDEINAVVEQLKSQGEPEYHSEILSTNLISLGSSQPDGSGGSVSSDDPLMWEAADIVVAAGFGSTSNIQRRLKVGYARAGRIMDMLEEKGVVGPPNGSKPREVLVDALELETLKAFENNDAASPDD